MSFNAFSIVLYQSTFLDSTGGVPSGSSQAQGTTSTTATTSTSTRHSSSSSNSSASSAKVVLVVLVALELLVLVVPSGTSTSSTGYWYTRTTSTWHCCAVRSATRVPSTTGGVQSTTSTTGYCLRDTLS